MAASRTPHPGALPAPFARAVAVLAALALALVAGLVAAVPASALGGGVTFDEGLAADGARVDDQYRFVSDGGTTGIRFGGTRVDLGWPGETECGGSGAGDYRPVLRQLSGNGSASFYAHSGARVLESASNNCTAGEFGTGGILFRCTIQCLSVSGFVGLGNQTATPPTPPDGMTFTASAYDVSGAAVASTPVVLQSVGALTGFSLTAPQGRAITFVKVVASGAVQSVLLDDLSYTVDPSALPAYVISTDATQFSVRPGSSTTAPFSIVRSNGSSGTITPTVSGLPAGVTATFSPTSFTGTSDGAVTLTLTASTSAVLGGPTSISVSASADPQAGTGAPVVLPLSVVPTLQALSDLPTLVGPACTAQARKLSVYVGDGSAYSGLVDVTASVDQPGWTVGVLSSPLAVVNGRVDAVVHWRRDSLGALATANVTVSARPAGHAGDVVSRTYPIGALAPAFSAATVTTTPPLGDRQPGDTLSLQAHGLCGTVKLLFGNSKALADGTVAQAPIASLPTNGVLNTTTVTVATPRLATKGTLRFDRGDSQGYRNGPALRTTGFRNTAGFPFTNYPVNDLTYQDMTDAFGADQTYTSIDLCFPFGCKVTFRDPIAMAYTAIVRAQTVGTEGSGHCYGMAMTAALMRAGGVDPADYLPFNSTTAFGLNSASGPSPALDRTIRVNHLKQFGLTFLTYWLKQHASNFFASGNDVVTQIRKAIDTQGGAIITVADQGGGHAVLAHSVEDAGPNDHYIDLYDPNWEYTAAEDSDFSGVEHEKRLDGSRLRILFNTWTLNFPDGTTWNGVVSGPTGSLVVVPLSEARKKQLLPSLFDIDQIISLVGSLVSFGSTGGTAKVDAGPGLIRYGATNWSDAGGVFLPAPTGTTTSASGGTVQISAAAADSVQGLLVSGGTVVSSRLSMSPGTDVAVQKVVGGQTVTSDTALPTQVTTARPGARSISTTASYVAPAGAAVTVAQRSTGVVVRSTAPITLTLRIENRTATSAGVTRTARIAIPASTALVVPTASLAGTGRTLAVTVGGKARSLAAVRARAGTVRVSGLRSARSGSYVVIAVDAAVKAAKGARGTVVVSVSRNGRVVATKRFAVTTTAAARGTTTTYRWKLVAAKGLVIRAVAAALPTTGASGLVSASRTGRTA